MKKTNNSEIISDESVMNKIYLIRGKKVMLDRDLAMLYGVSTGNLNLAVKRNKNRFPNDFMFVLSQEEFENLILQFAISRNGGWGGARKLPNVFTEQGVSMLSGIHIAKRQYAFISKSSASLLKCVNYYLLTRKFYCNWKK